MTMASFYLVSEYLLPLNGEDRWLLRMYKYFNSDGVFWGLYNIDGILLFYLSGSPVVYNDQGNTYVEFSTEQRAILIHSMPIM